jgi:hypothetical protein
LAVTIPESWILQVLALALRDSTTMQEPQDLCHELSYSAVGKNVSVWEMVPM